MKKNTFNIDNLKLKILTLFLGIHFISFGNIKENEAKSISVLPPLVTRTSTDIFYIDLGASTPINSAYASYSISSPAGSSIINDLWVEISNFSDVSAVEATSVNLASNEVNLVNLGALTAGNSATAYFYLTATAATLTDQTHIIKVYDGKPGAGGVLLNGATGTTMTFLSVESAISAASNKVATSIVGPPSNALGGLMTMTVKGNTGTVGTAKIFSTSPASFANWNPTAYELINSQFTFAYGAGTADDISYNNQLKFVLGSTTSTDYTLVFTFRAVTTTSSPTAVSPISNISSGAQIKHTTLDAAFLALAPIASAQNFLTLTKSTSTPILTSGGTGLYTITLTNTSTQALLVDDITDIMPLGTAYVAGSSTFGGLPITNPTITGQSLVWGNSSNFSIPASGSVSLTFSATIPNTKGNYTNSAYGNIGTTQIDTTLSTTDDSKATASIAVDNPPVAVDDNYTFTVNSTGNVLNLKANDTDIDGDSLTVVSINGTVLTPGTAQIISVPNGTIFVSSIGVISFSSAVNYSGSINFDYVISDGIVTDIGGVSIVVTPESNVGVTKTVDNETPALGSNVIFTIVANNAGPSTATGVSVTDVLPAGYTYVNNTAPSTGTFNSGTGVWSIGNLANGGSATLTITVTVNATGSYANKADIKANEADPTLENNTSTRTLTPVAAAQANVSIVKTVNNATPNVGDAVIFTLTASNAGPSTATGVSVTDVLPAGYTYVSNTAPSTGTFNSGTGVWTIGNLANGGSATLTITATVNATGSYANKADIKANEADPTLGNNTSISTPTPIASNVGDNDNDGIPDTTDIDDDNDGILDTTEGLNAGLLTALNGSNDANGVTVNATANITCPSGNISVDSKKISFDFRWNNGVGGGFSSQTIPSATSTQSVVSIFVDGTKYMDITTPSDGGSNADNATNNGGDAIITIFNGATFTNSLPSIQGNNYINHTPYLATTGLSTIVMTIPANIASNVSYQAILKSDDYVINNFVVVASCATDTDNDGVPNYLDLDSDNDGVFDLKESGSNPNLDLDNNGIIDGSVQSNGLPTALGGTPTTPLNTDGDGIANYLDLDSDNDGCSDSNEYYNNNTSAAIGQQFGQTGGAIAPTNTNGTVIAASYSGTYTNVVTVGNVITTQPANKVTVAGGNTVFSVTIPVSGTVAYQWQESTNGGSMFTNIINSGIYSGATSASLNLTGVTSTQNGYDYRVIITKSDYVCGNIISLSADLIVTPQSNVGITKTVNNATPNVGSDIIFTLTATNAGPSSATGVNVTDVLPAGYTYVSNTAPSTGTFNSGSGVWSIGNLANGGSATLTITATVNATGSYANRADIAANEADPTLGNNTSTSKPIPVPQSNVGITKTVNNATPSVGSDVIFTLTATNAGPSSATGVNVTDVLPAGYTFVSSTTATGTYTSGTGIWSIGSLANGGNATLIITATVNATGSYVNTATIAANEADPTLGNNTSTSKPVVVAVIDAVNDGPATVASATTPTVILNVTDNDTLNTIAVTATNTDVTPITTGPLSIDINGNLIVAANTASGTYLITYELCESGASPANCNTAIVTVVVQNPLLAVNDGPITVATAEVSKVVLNVTSNDTLHGDPVTDANTNVTPQIAGPLSIASN
ncbi:beta strand repeat-containing protein, partial [Flavobacterium sp. XS1P32]|uniref:beta strand repeat-containing protein n=1 Tax=Flavobacterium sp. XS1P32 TaxID=3401726 RepID=UPI003AAAAA62